MVQPCAVIQQPIDVYRFVVVEVQTRHSAAALSILSLKYIHFRTLNCREQDAEGPQKQETATGGMGTDRTNAGRAGAKDARRYLNGLLPKDASVPLVPVLFYTCPN